MSHISTPHGPRTARHAHRTAIAAGIAIALSALAGPPAAAEPDRPTSTELAAVHAAVDAADVDGVAWYTDQSLGKVVATVDATVTAAERERVRDAAGSDPDALTVRRTEGTFRLLLGSGDAIHGSGTHCSVGFNVHNSTARGLLTAGHCGDQADTWYVDQDETLLVGPTVDSRYPDNDHALVRYDNTSLKHPGGYTAGDASVGRHVTRDGAASGTHTGTVTALDVSVKYEGGDTMHGMIETDVCAEPGDSGGALYDGSTALGITSGGSGDCSSGGYSFYQPVKEALHTHDVELS